MMDDQSLDQVLLDSLNDEIVPSSSVESNDSSSNQQTNNRKRGYNDYLTDAIDEAQSELQQLLDLRQQQRETKRRNIVKATKLEQKLITCVEYRSLGCRLNDQRHLLDDSIIFPTPIGSFPLKIDTTRDSPLQNCEFVSVLRKHGGSLRLLSDSLGVTGYPFKACEIGTCDNGLKFGVKLSVFPPENTIPLWKRLLGKKPCYEPSNFSNVELQCLYEFRNLILQQVSPHFVLPFAWTRCTVDQLVKDKIMLTSLQNLKEQADNGDVSKDVNIVFVEWCEHGDLLHFMNQLYQTITDSNELLQITTVLLFQFFYTLAVLQTKYPGFRHNDFHWGNILVDRTNKDGRFMGHYILYNFEGRKFLIPDIGFAIRIWDFDLTNIPNLIENKRVNDGSFRHVGILPTTSDTYYDIFFFLYCFYVNISVRFTVPQSINDFVLRYASLARIKYAVKRDGRLSELSSPVTISAKKILLSSELFLPYKRDDTQLQNASFIVDRFTFQP